MKEVATVFFYHEATEERPTIQLCIKNQIFDNKSTVWLLLQKADNYESN